MFCEIVSTELPSQLHCSLLSQVKLEQNCTNVGKSVVVESGMPLTETILTGVSDQNRISASQQNIIAEAFTGMDDEQFEYIFCK